MDGGKTNTRTPHSKIVQTSTESTSNSSPNEARPEDDMNHFNLCTHGRSNISKHEHWGGEILRRAHVPCNGLENNDVCNRSGHHGFKKAS